MMRMRMSDGAGTLLGRGGERGGEVVVVVVVVVGSLQRRRWAVWTLEGFESKTHADTLVTQVCNSGFCHSSLG
jgi:hypothetical protein